MKGRLLIRLAKLAVDKGPIILSGLAVIGVAATAYFAADGTPDALDALMKEEDIRREEQEQSCDVEECKVHFSPVEKIKIVYKYYIKAFVCGLATISCIVLSQGLNMKHIAALGGVVAIAESKYDLLENKVKELVGDEKFEEIKQAALEEELEPVGEDIIEERVDGSGERLFYDDSSKRYFWSTTEKVLAAAYSYNRELALKRQALANEWYDYVGLELTDEGSYLGHDLDEGEKYFGYQWADISLKDMPSDNPTGKVTVISFPFAFHNIDYHYCDFYGTWRNSHEKQAL